MLNEHVLSAWELAPVLDVAPVEAGSVNWVSCVRTAASLFFLRTYRTADVAVVEREHSLIAHMRTAGIPAVAPTTARDGRTLVAMDGTLHALYPQAEGEQIERAVVPTPLASAAGTMLAQLHNAARRLPDAGYRRYRLEWDAEA
ncbi:MAG TPA: hypothetical protein VFS21_20980 [Roseiflexaceae bacterium]|nr:hypothetical protein [Roseiflexaceae bacterium]